jgi:transcription elongation factor Elf1
VVDKQFLIRCPKCGHQGEVHALRMNETIVCPSCKKTFAAEAARVVAPQT